MTLKPNVNRTPHIRPSSLNSRIKSDAVLIAPLVSKLKPAKALATYKRGLFTGFVFADTGAQRVHGE
jgi:hypothetical protein